MSLFGDPPDIKSKCVHVVALEGYQPEMCEVTIPNLRRYAKRIGADFNLITTPKFPDYPPNYERLQIYEAGKNYAWNINIDADTILHPEFEDPTARLHPYVVASLFSIDLKYYFKWNKHFGRDGRGRGIADNFVVSSWFTHDIWKPFEEPYQIVKEECLSQPRQVSELCLSINLCKYGFRMDGVSKQLDKHYTIMCTDRNIQNPAELMIRKLQEWNDTEMLDALPPSLKHYVHSSSPSV